MLKFFRKKKKEEFKQPDKSAADASLAPPKPNEFFKTFLGQKLKLKKQEMTSTFIQKMARIGGWEIDLKKQETLWTSEMYQICGLDPQLPKKTILENNFFSKEERTRLLEHLDNCRSGQPFREIFKFHATTGQQKWIDIVGEPVRNLQGRITSLRGTFQDITPKIEALKRAEEASKELSVFFDISRDFLGIADFNGIFKKINPVFEKVLGHSNAEFLSQPFINFVHPDDVEKTLEEIKRLAEGKETCQFENRYRCKDGSYRVLNWSTAPDLKSQLLYATARDITNHHQTEAAYKLVLQGSQMGMMQTTQSGEIIFANPELGNIFGYSVSELIQQNFEMLIPQERRASHKILMKNFWKNPQAKAMGAGREILGLRRDGKEITLNFSLVPMESLTDKYAVFGFIDISYRKVIEKSEQTKQAAILANQAKSQFLAHISHEIRTPLTAIVGFAKLLDQSPEKSDCYLSIIRNNADHLQSLIEDILDLSKIESKQFNLNICVVNLKELVLSVVDLFSEKASNKNILLPCHFVEPLPPFVRTDPVRLKQILINILANAFKFTEKGSVEIEVTLKLRPSTNPQLVFGVSDTGCGISRAVQGEIFKPFCQESPDTQLKYGGTGLGLALSQELAILLGGNIRLISSELEVGSQFEISIDAGTEVSSKEQTTLDINSTSDINQKPPKLDLSSLEILIVEDSPDISFLIEVILKRYGISVTKTSTGEEAVELSLQRNFDLILMDLQLPKMDGHKTTELIRKQNSKVPILALSAHAMKEEKDNCLACGMDDYCTKPINEPELLKQIVKWTSKKG